MAEIHELVRRHGSEEAERMVSPADRHLIPIASRILSHDSSESHEIGFTYTGFCLTGLPHTSLGIDEEWTHTIEGPTTTISLRVEPGTLFEGTGWKKYAVPFGSKARLILLFLQTRAIQTGSPEIEIGQSMREWLLRMGLNDAGPTYKNVREQTKRIMACRMTFGWKRSGVNSSTGFQKENIISEGILFSDEKPDQPSLWQDKIKLGSNFFNALREHPVPYWEQAIRELSNNSQSIDIYIWLAYRLHILTEDLNISWAALHCQFGANYKHVRQFRMRFLDSLKLALTVYPEARVEPTKAGLRLSPSHPPCHANSVQVLLPKAGRR